MNTRRLIILFALSSALILGLKLINNGDLIHSSIWIIQLFFFSTFLIISRINQAGKFTEKNQLHTFIYISMAVRFFLSIIFLFILILSTKNQRIVLVSDFMVLYFVYTSFEIYFLIHNLRADLKKGDAKN